MGSTEEPSQPLVTRNNHAYDLFTAIDPEDGSTCEFWLVIGGVFPGL